MPKRLLQTALLSSILTAVGSAAFAQAPAPAASAPAAADTSFTVGEVVITAARPAGVQDVLTSVDILGPDIAQRQNVDSTFKVLGRVPGVLVTDFHQGGTNGSISFRGFNAEGGISAVKLLIDGVPSNSNDGYMWMLDSVLPIDIASVEVVKGTSDPRYGLYNIAGNVAFNTRIGGTYADAKATAGSFGTYDAQAALGYESGAFSQNYAVGYRRSDGYRDRGDSNRTNLAGKWFYTAGAWRVGAIARWFRASGNDSGFLTEAQAESRPKYSPPINSTDGRKRKGGEYSLQLDGDLASDLTFSGRAYLNDFDDTRFFRITAAASQQERILVEKQKGAVATVKWSPEVSFLDDFSLEGGVDWHHQDNQAIRYLSNNRVRTGVSFDRAFTLDVVGAYMQAVIQPTDWLKITPAYRLDWVDGDFTNRVSGAHYPAIDYGTIHSPKISAVVTAAPGVSFYANYGRTYQIGLGVSSYLIPPVVSNVKPSTNTGWEGGAKYRRGWVEGRIALWQQKATDEILLQNLTGDFVNLGATRRRGVDVEVSVRPSAKLNAWLAATWQKGVIDVPDPSTPTYKGNLIDHVPKYQVAAGVDYRPIEPLRLSLTYNGQPDSEVDTSNSHGRFGGQSTLNAEIAYDINSHLQVGAEVQNLTDDRSAYVYYDPGSRTALFSPHDGRAFYANLRVRY